jgi:hypothetical protein
MSPRLELPRGLTLLRYMHAPIVAFYFAGAHTIGFCVLQKPKIISHKRRRGILAFTGLTLLAYIAEVLYYFSRSLAEREYEPPKPAAIRCLGSILTWGPLLYQIWSSKSLRWHPYFGAFVLHFAFETTTCLISGFSIPADEIQHDVSFVISCMRAVVSLFLLVDAFAILITKHMEQGSDEERQSLLNKPANGSANGTTVTDYGLIPQAAPSGDEEGETGHTDRDKEIKEKQAKRLEEEGGWSGYLKAFAIFLPYLFPKNDRMVMGALFMRLLHMLQGRVLNLLHLGNLVSSPTNSQSPILLCLGKISDYGSCRAMSTAMLGLASSTVSRIW